MLGFIILIAALIIVIRLLITIQEPSSFDDVQRKALTASDDLMSAGYPDDWNESAYVKPGLLTNNQLDLTKLGMINNLSYNELRSTLTGSYDLYWYFTNGTNILNHTACGYGNPAVTTDDNCTPTIIPEKNLVKVQRLLVHNNSIIRMVVIVWD